MLNTVTRCDLCDRRVTLKSMALGTAERPYATPLGYNDTDIWYCERCVAEGKRTDAD